MSERYKVYDQTRPYFISFAVEGRLDVFTRPDYRDIVVDSLQYCHKEKGFYGVLQFILITEHFRK